ncbi:MAG: precorrin-8X methylmutase [Eubacteriaceae bacterium]|jgi:precorrin-8X/cobalt-precorrin-8 methylmutase|uniref:Precorrin-8X methylmutase n=1 Tax=Candidatus Pseudoramibacter fermentans TaxID=2594427 RepID=A0A6L5GTL4_9FIRM|nr:precorrin-8X methylmutase [Candidatus Pseudoramibacter fermentans]RRF93338.1 MAG: precorrin-8X methylmutase [Eubacteriaceae bacterium]
MRDYVNEPHEIEKKSFEIIGRELGGIKFPEETDSIVKRVIHTTADFEYARLIEFKNNAVARGLNALKAGKHIYADTGMIKAAVNNRALAMQHIDVLNFVHDDDVIAEAKKRGVTRSTVAMEKAVNREDVSIFAIGNAPTALYRLIDLIKDGAPKPDLIVGAPIGFVGAAESKAALDELDPYDIPYIRINGRKGGSPVVGAILNAMLYKLGRDW